MGIVSYNMLFCAAALACGLCVAIFVCAAVAGSAGRADRCTRRGTATLVGVTKGRNGAQCLEIAYTCDGTEHRAVVPQKYAQGLSAAAPLGTQATVWYDPKRPQRVVVAEERPASGAWRRARNCALALTLVFGCFAAYALPRREEVPPSAAMTTIGQLSEELAALKDRSPTALSYTESDGAPDTFVAEVRDPAVARQALDALLSAAVDARGCYLDMYLLKCEEYRFAFGEETFTLSFVPRSYFCYGSQYYELAKTGWTVCVRSCTRNTPPCRRSRKRPRRPRSPCQSGTAKAQRSKRDSWTMATRRAP